MLHILRSGPTCDRIPLTDRTSSVMLCSVKNLVVIGTTILLVVANVPIASRFNDGR